MTISLGHALPRASMRFKLVRTGRPAPGSLQEHIEHPCFGWGLPARTSPCSAVSSYLTISPLPAGGMFLWHFPSSCLDRTLSCTLPYEARTFLTSKKRGHPAYSAPIVV